MIRKWTKGKKIEDTEKVGVANKNATIRKDGEKATLVKGEKYIYSGYYAELDEFKIVSRRKK